MDDMTAFERQVGDEIFRIVGPARPVDDLAVFEVAANQRNRWGFTMFSAFKFVAASIIVALFGGFLLAGVLTIQQGDVVAPAAVSASPTAVALPVPTKPMESTEPVVRTDILAGVELNVRRVEPGVYLVIDDGVRTLSPMREDSWKTGIRVREDGTAWLVRDRWFARLGEEKRHDLPAVKSIYGGLSPRGIEFAPDGTVWAITVGRGDDELGILRSYNGERWTRRSPRQGVDVADMEVGPDGTVWASWTETGQKRKTIVGTVGPDGLERVAVADGDPGIEGLAITHDGDPLLQLDQPYRGSGPIHASRYAGGSWQDVAVDGPGMTALGPDGSVWALSARDQPHLDDNGNEYAEAIPLDTLLRIDGEEHQSWELGGGMPTFADHYRLAGSMQVAPDGGLWVSYPFLSPVATGTRSTEAVYDGVSRFDGTAWQRYLRGYLVEIMDIEADGSVWVRAGQVEEGEVWPDDYGMFVIDPDAQGAVK